MPARWPSKQRKHRNKKVERDGEKFDSIREYNRYNSLCLAQKLGQIEELKRQVPFILAPSVMLLGEKRMKPTLKFTADFTYVIAGRLVVEDAKSPHLRKETAYRMRKHLLKAVHGLDVVEV